MLNKLQNLTSSLRNFNKKSEDVMENLEKYIVLYKQDNGLYSFDTKNYDPENTSQKVIKSNDPRINAVVPVMPIKPIEPIKKNGKVVPHPTINNIAWGVKAVGADTSPYTGEDIVVAVIDSGIFRSHPAFSGIEIIEKNFTNEADGDSTGHGTHCAGTIVGRDVNGKRIGVARGVTKLLIAKVNTEQGNAESDKVIEALQWATDQGANVISMSFEFNFPYYVKKLLKNRKLRDEVAISRGLQAYWENIIAFQTITSSIQEQVARAGSGIIILAAAGNGSDRTQRRLFEISVGPPGIIDNIISVGALERVDNGYKVASFSNTNPDLAAPGVDVLSASISIDPDPDKKLVSFSATSMATPYVAGVAALWAEKLKKEGKLSTSELIKCVNDSATMEKIDPNDSNATDVGKGMIRAPQD